MATNSITTGPSFTIANNAGTIFIAGNTITLNSGFTAELGSKFYACIAQGQGGSFPLAKFASSTNIEEISDSIEQTEASQYRLLQNYPNPFNPTTTFKYFLKEDVKVSLKIYNILGQEVRTLVDERQSAGYRFAIWNGKDNAGGIVPSGLYIYKIVASDFVEIRKMILLK